MTTTERLYSIHAPKKAEHLPGPSTRKLFLTLIAVILLATYAGAQLPMPASTQFDLTGFIQEATLDSTCAANAHCGGTIKLVDAHPPVRQATPWLFRAIVQELRMG